MVPVLSCWRRVVGEREENESGQSGDDAKQQKSLLDDLHLLL